MSNRIYPYQWHTSKNTEENYIRVFGLDKENKSVCVTITDFFPYIYVELPSEMRWTEAAITALSNKLDEKCKQKIKRGRGNIPDKVIQQGCTPVLKGCVMRKKLYYANVDDKCKPKKFPFFKLSFYNQAEKNMFIARMKRPFTLLGVGIIKLKFHEQNANQILQLVCTQNITTAGWIKFKGDRVCDGEKETLCDKEFVVKHKNMVQDTKCEIVPDPLLMGFDIEVNSSNVNAMPKAVNPEDKVFQISCIFSRQSDPVFEKYLLTLGTPTQDGVGSDVVIQSFPTEDQLLCGFTELVREKNPQILCGYNILGFDLPYMIKRASYPCMCEDEFFKMSLVKDVSSPVEKISWSSSAYKNQNFEYIDAEGRLFVDLLPLVQRDYKFSNYKLKTVTDFFLGETKDPLSVKDIFRCYRSGVSDSPSANDDMAMVGKYCVQDSVLVNKLFYTLQTWVGLCEMAKTCCVPIFYLYTKGQQIKVFSQIYKKCFKDKIVVQKDGYQAKSDESYTGATVFPPKPGAYDRVVPFDFSSLYPTTIIAYNIDYSTLVEDESVPDEKCHIIEWDDHVGCEHDTTERATKPTHITCGHYKYRFLKEPMGVMPAMLKYLLDTRKVTKNEIKTLKKKLGEETDEETKKQIETKIVVLDKRQLAYKVSANSMYGSMGVKFGYLPFLPGAMCTTARGRQSIERAARIIKNKYFGELVYGDTDSCYIHFKQYQTSEEIWDYCMKVEKELFDMNVFPKPMKLEFEEVIYWRFFILTKKRYMALSCGRDGVVEDNIMKKGVLLARRDNSEYIRNVYEKIIMAIFNRKTKEEVFEIINDEVVHLMSHTYPQTQFIITKSVGDISDYKIRPLPDDEKKRKKRLADLGIPEDYNPQQVDELYRLRCLPAQMQLAEKMRRRGGRVDAGSRIEYVVVCNAGLNAKLFDKLEDPPYRKKHSDVVKLDFLYYLKLLINPADQALEVGYGCKKYVDDLYKRHVLKYKLLKDIKSREMTFE